MLFTLGLPHTTAATLFDTFAEHQRLRNRRDVVISYLYMRVHPVPPVHIESVRAYCNNALFVGG